jgi:hypothetical protein
MTFELKPCPKPAKRVRNQAPLRPRKPMRKYNAKREGRMFAGTRDDERQAWIRQFPCAICIALGVEQTTPTEVEHFKTKSHGGEDRKDLYPTCGAHREMRHVVMGTKAFTRMLKARGFDEAQLCKKLAALYDAERYPCP